MLEPGGSGHQIQCSDKNNKKRVRFHTSTGAKEDMSLTYRLYMLPNQEISDNTCVSGT